jgi:hypothetical protein
MAGGERGDVLSVFLAPLPLRPQVLRCVGGRAILPLLKLPSAGFRTHRVAVVTRVQTRAPVYRHLHFPAAHAAILDEIAIKPH